MVVRVKGRGEGKDVSEMESKNAFNSCNSLCTSARFDAQSRILLLHVSHDYSSLYPSNTFVRHLCLANTLKPWL